MNHPLRIVALMALMALPLGLRGQIFAPEGLNMPGTWNSFSNPPTNAKLRGVQQVGGLSGDIELITTGIRRYQTRFSVAATGADLVGGSYTWLFTSGSSSNYYANKWAGVAVSLNSKQTYTYNSGSDNTITITDGKHYVMNWRDVGYANTQAIFLELSEAPTTIASISDTESVADDQSYTVELTVADALATEEKVYVRYTTDNYATSFLVAATFDGTSGEAVIPAQTAGSTVSYYAFTTVGTAVESDVANADLYSIDISDGGGYSSVSAVEPPAAIVLTSPANSATDVGLRPTFTWEEDADATSYTLQISTDSEFGTTDVNATGLTDESYAATVNLRMATTYYWRVRGSNGGGDGEWSASRSFTTVLPTVSLMGNGGGGFGETIGGSTLYLTHDATHVYLQVNKGLGDWNDVLTLYLDTKSGGFASTSTLTDEGDEHRKAASGFLSDITFPTGFEADYAITLDTDFAGLWVLSTGAFASPTSLSATVPGATTAVHTLRVAKSDMTFDTENTFSLVGTYGNANSGFRSNESYSIGLGSSNPGEADITLRSFHNYPSGSITADVKFFGNAGWRFLANPFTGKTVDDYMGPLWTQGFTGSDFPGAGASNSNVRTLDASGAWVSVASQSANMEIGSGYAAGIYTDDTYGVAGEFPKTVTVTGTPSYTSVGAPLNGENTYALAGNPYPFAVDFDSFAKTGVADIVYVYDYEPSGSAEGDVANSPGLYRSWNGTAGSLTGGRIAPFQGFLVYQNAAGGSLTMEADDRTSPTVFRGKAAPGGAVELIVKGQGLYSNTWLDLREGAESGLDSKDAFKIASFESRQARLYTIGGGTALDINHLPLEAGILPLGIESTVDGPMTLSVGDWSLPDGWRLHLTDSETGARIRLEPGMTVDVMPVRVARKSQGGLFERVEAASVTRYALEIDPGTSTSTPDAGRETPDAIALEQNYPNPFNPSTQIRFTLDAGRQTTLKVYDILGREVAVLVNGTLPAGSHTVNFDASNLTSGVYVYTLEAGGVAQTKRMTLLK